MFRSAEFNLFRAPLRGGGAPGPQKPDYDQRRKKSQVRGIIFSGIRKFFGISAENIKVLAADLLRNENVGNSVGDLGTASRIFQRFHIGVARVFDCGCSVSCPVPVLGFTVDRVLMD